MNAYLYYEDEEVVMDIHVYFIFVTRTSISCPSTYVRFSREKQSSTQLDI